MALPTLTPIPGGIKVISATCAGLAYGQKQIFDALENVGVYSDKANIGAAIAMAESGGVRYCRHKNSDGSTDRGPFQINNHAHPDVSDKCAFDLQCAAEAARKISHNGSDWSAWTTYGSGTGPYKQYLKNYPTSYPGKTTIQDVATGPIGDAAAAVDSALDPLKQIVGFVGQLFQASTWFRVGKVLLGAVVLLLVAYELLR